MRKSAVIAAIAAVVIIGLAGGYMFFGGEDTDRTIGLASAVPIVEAAEPNSAEPATEPATESQASDIEERVVLSPTARIEYRYHYLKDGHIETSSEEIPYFLVGLERTALAEKLMGWDLVEFEPELAVFEKKLNARSTERYTVGIENGYVAVFYDEEVNGSRLKEQTRIPIDALSEDELSRLSAGIRVIGDEQLAKALEDYGS